MLNIRIFKRVPQRTSYLFRSIKKNEVAFACKREIKTSTNGQDGGIHFCSVLQRIEFVPKNPEKPPTQELPDKTKVVICGGGIMGASVAYHLALFGHGKEIILLEQAQVGGGSPWHESGLAGAFKPSLSEVKLAQYSINVIKDFTKKGLPTGWKQCGSLNVARTYDRMIMYKRMKSQGA